jgi:uncharacterized protein (TIRG00374 family)
VPLVSGSYKRHAQPSASRRLVRVAVQATVSLVLIAVLVGLAHSGDVIGSLQAIPPAALAAVAGLQLLACVLNSRRWQLLLRALDVRQRLRSLTGLYFIGQFFSLFLPTSVGGDAVRIYQVARRSGKTAQSFLATFQERLLGLGVTVFLGLVATFYYLALLPSRLRLAIVLLQVAAVCGAAVLLYPPLVIALGRGVWSVFRNRPRLRRLSERPLAFRLRKALQTIRHLPPLTVFQLVPLLGLTLLGVMLGVATYTVLAHALQIDAGFLAFCLVVPLVWIVKLLPVSLNGIGVGEGASVYLLGLFAVPASKALALALVILGLQTALALLGGVILAVSLARGSWTRVGAVPDGPAETAPFTPRLRAAETGADVSHKGEIRHAA